MVAVAVTPRFWPLLCRFHQQAAYRRRCTGVTASPLAGLTLTSTCGVCDNLRSRIRLTLVERNCMDRLAVSPTLISSLSRLVMSTCRRLMRPVGRDGGFAGHASDRRDRQLRHIVRNFHRVLKLVRVERCSEKVPFRCR